MVWYDPTLVFAKKIMLPQISRSQYPDPGNGLYDVFGIAQQQLFLRLNARGAFDDVGIVATASTNRKKIDATSTTANWLVRLPLSSVIGLNGEALLSKGDYILTPVDKPDGSEQLSYGYPIKLAIVDPG